MIRLNNQSPGAPSLVGANGSLCNVLDWALPQAGWAIEYTAANARVYRPGQGNRHRLSVRHDSAVSGSVGLCTIRGCENATSATALVDPFPTVTQASDPTSTILVGTNTTVPREFETIVTPTFMLLAVGALMNNTAGWDLMFFGDLPPTYPEDQFSTAILVGASSAATSSSARAMSSSVSSGVAAAKLYWARTIDGSMKSPAGSLWGSVSAVAGNFCTVANTTAMRAGYRNEIVRERVGASCAGGPAVGPMAVVRRAQVPFLWNPVHTGIGSITSDDTFTDTAYAAGSLFRVVPASSAIAAILELSNTWAP